MEKEKIILGIDPGTNITGYGLLMVKGTKLEVMNLGVISLQKIKDPYLKLERIFNRVLSLVDEFHPDELAIEAPFFGKNVQSMLKLGRAQGVAMAAALYRSVPIHEYAPRKIKMAITGQGNATKEQVAIMLVSILKLKELPNLPDATDGLAAAVCHHFQSMMPESGKSVKSWKEFINKNPGRVKS